MGIEQITFGQNLQKAQAWQFSDAFFDNRMVPLMVRYVV